MIVTAKTAAVAKEKRDTRRSTREKAENANGGKSQIGSVVDGVEPRMTKNLRTKKEEEVVKRGNAEKKRVNGEVEVRVVKILDRLSMRLIL